MLKATLAVKVAAGVLGGVLLTGGGIALATDTHPTFDQPSVNSTDQPSGQPGTTCAPEDQNDQGAVGTQAPDAEASGEAGDHNAQGTMGTHGPDAEATGEAGDQNEQGGDCDENGGHGTATEGPETDQSEGPEADQTGNSGNHSQGDDEHSAPEASNGTHTGSQG